jgi:hypothetical protein
MILSFCRGVNDIFTLLGCYAALFDNYRNSGQPVGFIFGGEAVVDCLTLEDESDW